MSWDDKKDKEEGERAYEEFMKHNPELRPYTPNTSYEPPRRGCLSSIVLWTGVALLCGCLQGDSMPAGERLQNRTAYSEQLL